MRGAWCALALAGCLPLHAVSRRAEQPAERHRIAVHASLSGAGGVTVVDLRGVADVQRTRRFRDGSQGRLVTLHPDGGGPLDGAWVELRSFGGGRLLRVDNLEPWAGTHGHIELIDDLWAALTPPDPGVAALRASWPGTLWSPWAWTVDGTWDAALPGYRMTLAMPPRLGRGAGSDAEGDGHRTIRMADGGVEVASERTLRRAGAPTRVLDASASAEPVGPVPPVAFDMPYSEDDAAFDALPLRLAQPSGGVQAAFRGPFDARAAGVFASDGDSLPAPADSSGPASENR